jgi:hypothetical protein
MTHAGSFVATCAPSAGKAWRGYVYFYFSGITEGRTRP